jgi:hypothetical protein
MPDARLRVGPGRFGGLGMTILSDARLRRGFGGLGMTVLTEFIICNSIRTLF